MPHPALVQALARDRAAELRHAGTPYGRRRREKRLNRSMRNGAGWLLVEVGLRLAMSGGTTDRSAGDRAAMLLSERGRSA